MLCLTTGQAARMLGTTELKLAEAARRGNVRPGSQVLAGVRLWTQQPRQAARRLHGFTAPRTQKSEEASRG